MLGLTFFFYKKRSNILHINLLGIKKPTMRTGSEEVVDRCRGCGNTLGCDDTSHGDGWTGQWFVVDGYGKKDIKAGLWCRKCAGPLASPGLCTGVPSSSCLRYNQIIIISKSTNEELFSCTQCAISARVTNAGFIVKRNCCEKVHGSFN